MKYTNLPKSIFDTTMPFAGGANTQSTDSITTAFHAWKKQDSPVTRKALLQASQPVIDSAVYSYAGKNASPAIKSQAKLLALDAMRSYDPNKGPAKTHILSQLRRLQRLSAQSQQIISVPERILMDKQHLRETEENLQDQLGRDPSDAEIADAAGLSLKRIAYIRSAKMPINTGNMMDEAGEVYSPASSLPGQTPADDVWTEMVYNDADPVSQTIMDYTLGLHGSPVYGNAEIARRLGLTPGAISQRKARIQALLDERYTASIFGE